MSETKAETRHSRCDNGFCGEPISLRITGDQRWSDATWQHDDPEIQHRVIPELRYAIDATCPACGYPEIGYAPTREEFVCSRCQHTQTERPKD